MENCQQTSFHDFPSSQITFLTFLLNKNHTIDEKFKLKYNFNNTLCISLINRRLWLRKACFPIWNWRWCSILWLRIKWYLTNSTILNPLQIAKDLHLHGNFPRITDSLFYTSFSFKRLAKSSHIMLPRILQSNDSKGLRWSADIFLFDP